MIKKVPFSAFKQSSNEPEVGTGNQSTRSVCEKLELWCVVARVGVRSGNMVENRCVSVPVREL